MNASPMEAIVREPTARSPKVVFDFANGRFTLAGESYPEDAAAFFGPLLRSIRTYLDSSPPEPIVCDLEMSYFNSSSAKALMTLFQMLEDAADEGRSVTINWHFHPDDDTMAEFGEDFAQDFHKAGFHLCPIA